jgi:hypothetical protein
MTSFVHTEYPSQHPGVARAEQAAQTIKSLAAGFNGARGAATLLLSAVVAALLVVANQVVDTWTEGHLLMAWIVMWTIAFAALALLASPARNAGSVLRTAMRAWSERRKQATADEQAVGTGPDRRPRDGRHQPRHDPRHRARRARLLLRKGRSHDHVAPAQPAGHV